MSASERELIFRVSHMDVFREWEGDEDSDLASLIADITSKQPTHAMKRGTAFHAALENLREGEVSKIESQGYTFVFPEDFEAPLFQIQELRGNKVYDGLIVTGQVDAIQGNHILDHKASESFDAERYMAKYAWRYYLDIFKAERFSWYVWQMYEDPTDIFRYTVKDLHILEQYRYPELERDCSDLAAKMKSFAEQYLTEIHA